MSMPNEILATEIVIDAALEAELALMHETVLKVDELMASDRVSDQQALDLQRERHCLNMAFLAQFEVSDASS